MIKICLYIFTLLMVFHVNTFAGILDPKKACTSEELWKDSLFEKPGEGDGNLEIFLGAVTRSDKNDANYWVARSLFGLGLVAQSRREFERILITDPSNKVAKICIARTDQVDAETEKGKRELALLDEAYALFKSGKYDQATQKFLLVKSPSMYLSRAQGGMMWSELAQGHWEKVLGIGLGFQMPPLNERFAPESLYATALVLNENCHFPEAKRTLAKLESIYAREVTTLSLSNVYHKLIQFLKNPNQQPGRRTFVELANSPHFIYWQNKLNKVLENREQLRKLGKILPKNLVLANGRFKEILRTGFDECNKSESVITAKIEAELMYLKSDLRARLELTVQKAGFLEAEVLNGGSDHFLSMNKKVSVSRSVASAFQKGIESWNTTKFDIADTSDEEVWLDEVGSFKAKITNICRY